MLQDVSGVASGPIFLPATVQGNQLVATIPAVSDSTTLAAFRPDDRPPSAAGARGNPLWTIAGMKSSGHVTSSNSNFIVYFFDATMATASDLLVSLDDAYSKLGALGLDWSRRTNKPITANLYQFTGDDAQKAGLEGSLSWGRQRQQLDFNSTFMTDATERRVTAGHELFHLLQNLYDPRTLFQVAKFSSSWLWMLEASSTWFERLMVNDAKFVPGAVKRYVNFLDKHGLEYPSGDQGTVQNHGYGAAMFLEHISRQKADNAVAEVIKLLAQGEGLVLPQPKYLPVEALNSVVGDVGAAWLQFCRNYMTGSVYSGFPEPVNVSSLATGNRARFLKETDAAVTFTWNAPDLSARVYSVAFDLLYQWPANTKLSVSLTDPGGQAEAIIYKAGAGFTVWSSAGTVRAAAWEYPDVAELVKNRVSLIIMVANGRAVKPYSGTTPITLKVEIPPSGLLPLLQKTKVVKALLIGCSDYPFWVGSELTLQGPNCPLTWSGTRFSWGCTDVTPFGPTATYTSQGSGTVNADATTLLTIQGTLKVSDATDPYGGGEQTWSLKNFPCAASSSGQVECRVQIQSGHLADHLVQYTWNGQPVYGSGAGSGCAFDEISITFRP
jgi:hypothetical protein